MFLLSQIVHQMIYLRVQQLTYALSILAQSMVPK